MSSVRLDMDFDTTPIDSIFHNSCTFDGSSVERGLDFSTTFTLTNEEALGALIQFYHHDILLIFHHKQ
uniref:Uncharacterized protein n=1 Tax=Romanomermis culicivorax TaxID=13658 RepID=A0A915K6P2_ROMCU